MSNVDPLSAVAKLSRPINTLILKISEAAGVLYEPTRIVRKAKAEAKANEITAISKLRIREIQKRALVRFVNEETIKQMNIESTLEQALPQIKDTASPERIENDWISLFFDKIKLVSQKDIQSIWARILAGEANQPGSYSKKTLSTLSMMDKMDVEAMTRLFSFGCEMDGPIIFVYDFQNPIYARHGISFALLSHLDGLGLIRFDVLGGFKKFGLPRHVRIEYYEKLLELHYERESYNELAFGCVLLHQPGHELALLCRREGQFEIQQYLMEQWMQMGIAISSNIKEKPKTDVA